MSMLVKENIKQRNWMKMENFLLYQNVLLDIIGKKKVLQIKK